MLMRFWYNLNIVERIMEMCSIEVSFKNAPKRVAGGKVRARQYFLYHLAVSVGCALTLLLFLFMASEDTNKSADPMGSSSV